MGKALHLIAKLYRVEDRAKGLSAEERLALRQRLSAPVMAKLHAYLLKIDEEVLPKSPGARAMRNALNQWDELTRFFEDGNLEIDNGAPELPTATSPSGARTGPSLAATKAATPRPC